jgi:hypothetical protein
MRATYQSLCIALFLIVTFIISSCEPEVVTTLNLPQEEPRLAISAILESGDTLHSVFLTQSVSYQQSGGPLMNEVSNGTITISDGDKSVILIHVGGAEYRFYDADMPVLSGKTYTITAEAPGFSNKAYGSCTIPDDFQPELEFVSMKKQGGQYEEYWQMGFRFRSVTPGDSYYRISGSVIAIPYSKDSAHSHQKIEIYATGSNKELLHLESSTNQWHDMTYQLWDYFGMEVYDSLVPTDAEFRIYRTDEAYYKFHYPFIVNGYWGSDGNPFAEPTIIYTNITNGYGIAAGVIQKTVKLPLQ